MSDLVNRPRHGGANLECFMLAGSACTSNLRDCLPGIIGDFKLSSQLDLCLEYREFEYVAVSELSPESLLELLNKNDWRSLELRSRIVLVDVVPEVTVRVYRDGGVVVVSALEDMLWGYAESIEDLRMDRLEAFANLCRKLGDKIQASNVLIGSEPCTPSEFIELCSEANPSVLALCKGLSPYEVARLYKWYKLDYLPRWKR